MSRFLWALAVSALVTLACGIASAHTQSYGYLNVVLSEGNTSGRLELAATDAGRLIGLDSDGNGKITWGEVRLREREIAEALLAQISIGDGGRTCALAGQPLMTNRHGGETYLAVPFTASCPRLDGSLEIGYRLMFRTDAQHRGLVTVAAPAGVQSFVMTPASETVSVAATGGDAGLFLTFVKHGIHHILIGYDHILFVVTLLLGTLIFGHGAGPGRLLGDAARVVTAFTLAHSLTLGLAAFQILRIPPAVTESLIAVTISLAAANNLWPLVTRRLWLVAMGFGLIHGVGFANVLAELDLPRQSLLAALLSFNMGVELGQLTIVVVGLPLLCAIGRAHRLGRAALPVSSLVIVAIGGAWFADRAFGFSLMPF